MKKAWITTDCTCDLSEELLETNDIEVIHFYIHTEFGCFKDRAELTSNNIVEYFEQGGKQVRTSAPDTEEYIRFFTRMLKKHDEIIHITISSELSMSYQNAVAAAKQFPGKVHVFDTGHLSTGIAHFLFRAIDLLKNETPTDMVLQELECLKKQVSSSFIVYNADYLYRAGRVNKSVKTFCTMFHIHPVLHMKNGKLKLKTIKIGNYEASILSYVRSELRNSKRLCKERLFVTHSTCPVKILSKIYDKAKMYCAFDEVIETKASATITSNCGANAVGLLYVRKK